MSDIHYLIVKKKNEKDIAYFEPNNLKGFEMTSKNKKIRLKDAINVDKMIIINPSFIEKVINKQMNQKIKKLIDLIANIYNSDEEDPGAALMRSLNEVERFKRQMINKYIDYMTKEQQRLLEKKIQILEREVTMHAYKLNEQKWEEEVYETKKSR